jgi:hypothetical protein
MSRKLKAILLTFFLPVAAIAQDQISVDLATHWLRRDWDKCDEKVSARYQDQAFRIESDHAAALFWQIPTKTGQALEIDRNQNWIQKCDRPPMGFEKEIQKGNMSRLISVRDYPYLSWQWRIAGTIDDTNTANRKGEITRAGDDFAAKVGISILNENGELREIAYLWTRSIPEETSLTQVTSLLFGMVKFVWYRIVAQSGDSHLNTWVGENRNLYADFKRFYPNEEPREVVRVYIMSDSDNTGSTTSAAFSNLQFHKNAPSGYVKSE